MAAVFAFFVYTADGLDVEVDGSGSAGPVTDYDWDWGDGSAHASGATASHTYDEPGSYTITLTVTDGFLPDASARTFVVSYTGGSAGATENVSPRPIYLRLEDDSGDLLLEDGVSRLLLGESGERLFWANLNADNDWARRDAQVTDVFSTICAVPTSARYWRFIMDDCPDGSAVVSRIYLDTIGGQDRAPSDLVSNTSNPAYTVSASTGSPDAYQVFDGNLSTGLVLTNTQYVQLSSDTPIRAARIGLYSGSALEYVAGWHVEVSDDGTNYRSIGAFSSGGAEVGLSRSNVTPVDPARTLTSYRYWRLETTSDEGSPADLASLSLRRHGLAITPSTMSDNTTPAPYVASASSNPSTAYQAFDGLAGTTWAAGASAAGEYIQIDLGAAAQATELLIDQPTAVRPSWRLLGSNDLTTFYEVATIPANTVERTYELAWGPYFGVTPVNYFTIVRSIENLLLYFPFGDSGLADVTGNGYLLTAVSGTATLAGPSASLTGGASARADSATTELTLADPAGVLAGLGVRTYNMWFRTPSVVGRQTLWAEGDSSTGLNIYLDNDRLYAGWWSPSVSPTFLSTPAVLTADRWYQVTTVYDNGWLYLYLDGRYQASAYFGALGARTGLSILANGSSTVYHDGASVGPAEYVDNSFLLGELTIHNLAIEPADALMLRLVGRENNVLSKQDDLVFNSTNPGGTDPATAQSHPAALSAFFNAETATPDLSIPDELVLAGSPYLTSRFANGPTLVAATGRVIVGPSTTLQTVEFFLSLSVDLLLFGEYQIVGVTGQSLLGAGNLVVVGEDAQISAIGMDSVGTTHSLEVTVTSESVDQAKLAFGGVAGAERETTLFNLDGPAGGQLLVANLDITGGARVRLDRVPTAAYDLSGVVDIQSSQLQWWGVDGAQSAGQLIVRSGGTLQLGSHSTDTPEFAMDVQLDGGTVLFQEFADTPVVEIAAASAWTISAPSTIEVNMAEASRRAVQFFGTFTGGQDLFFSMAGAGGWVWANETDDPAWGETTVTSDLSGFTPTDRLVGFASPVGTEAPGDRTRSFGSGQITLLDAGLWLGHYQPDILTLSNPVLVSGYAVIALTSSDDPAADQPRVSLGGDLSLDGELYLSSQNTNSTALHSISGDILVGQGVDALRVLHYASGSDEDLSIAGEVRDLGSPILNCLTVYQGSTAPSIIDYLAGAGSQNICTRMTGAAGAGSHRLGRVFTGDVRNEGANLVMDGAQVDSYYQETLINGGGALDMNGSTFALDGLFRVTEGTVSGLGGAAFTAGTWAVDGVDMIGASEWTVVASDVRPTIRNATLTWSNATGSVDEGIIYIPEATDGGDNTFWLTAVDSSSPHIFYPEVSRARAYDLRWVQAFSVQGGVAHVSFWGDSTPRVSFSAPAFLLAWSESRAANPTLPWLPDVTGDATLVVGQTTYNLLFVDGWWVLASDSTRIGVRLCATYTELAAHSADGQEPVLVLDRTNFEAAMSAFTLGA